MSSASHLKNAKLASGSRPERGCDARQSSSPPSMWPSPPKRPGEIALELTTSGAIFMGGMSPVVAGDFLAGPSHELPTGGAGKGFAGTYCRSVPASHQRRDVRRTFTPRVVASHRNLQQNRRTRCPRTFGFDSTARRRRKLPGTVIWKFRRRSFDLTRRGVIMGVLNVTPDSFSDAGNFLESGRSPSPMRCAWSQKVPRSSTSVESLHGREPSPWKRKRNFGGSSP